MSKREKSITLYSRNGIRIVKTINIDTNKFHNYIYKYENFTRIDDLEKKEHESLRKGHYETQKFVSKLGFYYTKTIYITPNNNINNTKNVSYKNYIIWLNGTKYELIYPFAYYSSLNNVVVNKYDNRPWDIVPGYKGMPDHFINTLYREVLKFIDILYENKNNIKFKAGVDNIKNEILRDLFGDEDGPKQQPNDIKILSHGFDLKTSFRKPKEEK